MIAGLAWLASAALTGYLVWQQWSTASALKALGSAGGPRVLRSLERLPAALTAYFGARLLTGASRRMLASVRKLGRLDRPRRRPSKMAAA